MTAPAPALEVRDVDSGYGDLQVLRGVTLTAQPGAVELIIGPNGAGKSTLLATIAGLLRTWRGTVSTHGTDITAVPAYRRSPQYGVGLVLSERRVFKARTVRENLLIGGHGRPRREVAARIDRVLTQLPLLAELTARPAGSLSGGQQQLLAIGQALVADPKVLLLDEPSAGLAPAAVDAVVELLGELKAAGTCLVLVEQIVDRVLPVADHVTVMTAGRVSMHGPPERFRDEGVLHDAYFGHRD